MTTWRKVTLCGSTRFRKAYREWEARLALDGCLVYTISHWDGFAHSDPPPRVKARLDALHLAKIDASDEIFVLDVGGYIGASTAREVAHAHAHGKTVRYLSREHPAWTEDQCELWRGEPPTAAAPGEVPWMLGPDDVWSATLGESALRVHRSVDGLWRFRVTALTRGIVATLVDTAGSEDVAVAKARAAGLAAGVAALRA